MQIVSTSSADGSIKMLADQFGLHDKKMRNEDPHGRSLLPYKMAKVCPWSNSHQISANFEAKISAKCS